jgi:stage V sporulation protein B
LASGFGDLVRGSARGSLILMVGQVITTVISAVTMIWIARVIGDDSYGLYTVALVPVSLFMLLQDLGVSQALMRFCAMYRHEGRQGLRGVVYTGLLFSGVTSLFFSVLLFVFAEPVASLYLQRPEVASLVRAAALSILGQGLLTTVQAVFAGYEMMALRSVTQIIYSVVRGVVGVALTLVGFGAFGAALSYTVALMLSAVAGVVLVFAFVRFGVGGEGASLASLRMLLGYGFPLSLGGIIGGVLSQIYNTLMILYASTDAIGNYGAAANFGVLVTFFTVPIATVLFPLFSKFKRGDPQLEFLFRSAVKYTSMLTLPVVLVMIVLASPLSRVVFTREYPLVPLYLSLFILTFAFEGLGGISLSNLISGLGESRVLLVSSVCVFVVGAVLALVLVPSFQIVGLLVTMVVAPRAGWLYQTLWVRRNVGLSVDWGASLRVYVSGFAAFAVSYLVVNGFKLQGWVALVVGGFCFLVVYALGLPLSGALTRVDVGQLEAIAEGMGPLRGVLMVGIRLFERFMRA